MPEKCMFTKRYTLHLNSATSTVMTSNSAQWTKILDKTEPRKTESQRIETTVYFPFKDGFD